jgi:hypothetical protein
MTDFAWSAMWPGPLKKEVDHEGPLTIAQDAQSYQPTFHPGDDIMREQTTLTLDIEQAPIRELSIDEIEMVGGGFGLPHINWGKIEHKAEGIVHTAINNAKSHDWKNVGTDAVFGWGIGSAFGGEGAVIGGLAGADYALYRQDFG